MRAKKWKPSRVKQWVQHRALAAERECEMRAKSQEAWIAFLRDVLTLPLTPYVGLLITEAGRPPDDPMPALPRNTVDLTSTAASKFPDPFDAFRVYEFVALRAAARPHSEPAR